MQEEDKLINYTKMLEVWDGEISEWEDLGKELVVGMLHLFSLKSRYQISSGGLNWDIVGVHEERLHEIARLLLYGVKPPVKEEDYKTIVQTYLQTVVEIHASGINMDRHVNTNNEKITEIPRSLNADKASARLLGDTLNIVQENLREDTEDLALNIEVL